MNPTELRQSIARDLSPARPLLPPSVRALAIVPIALATVVAVPAMHFYRSDFAILGVWRAWGLSFAEVMVGVAVIALALRESVPGRALSRAALMVTFAGGLLTPFIVLLLTARNFSTGAPPGSELSDAVYCFRTSSFASVPALLTAAMLVWRAFPLRPGVTGGLYGLGCGVIADAGLRLFCEFTEPSHVIAAHGGAVAAVMCVGVLAGVLTRPR